MRQMPQNGYLTPPPPANKSILQLCSGAKRMRYGRACALPPLRHAKSALPNVSLAQMIPHPVPACKRESGKDGKYASPELWARSFEGCSRLCAAKMAALHAAVAASCDPPAGRDTGLPGCWNWILWDYPVSRDNRHLTDLRLRYDKPVKRIAVDIR